MAGCATLAFAGLTAGCALQGYGTAAAYNRDVLARVDVVMPANAPSISQQFRVGRASAQDRSFSADHEGIDIIAASGTPVVAAAPGRVVASFAEPMYGNRVVIEHSVGASGRRTRTVYKHLNARLVREGQTVARGQQIGTLGRTGILAAGILHLHFEVRQQVGSGGYSPFDPHLFWAGGVGRVTCYEPGVAVEGPRFLATYPVVCKPAAVLRGPDGRRTAPPTGAWVDDLFDREAIAAGNGN